MLKEEKERIRAQITMTITSKSRKGKQSIIHIQGGNLQRNSALCYTDRFFK